MNYIYFWSLIDTILDFLQGTMGWIVKQVSSALGNVFSWLFKQLYEIVLDPLLHDLVMFILDMIWQALNKILTRILVEIEVKILEFIDTFTSVIETLLGQQAISHSDGVSTDLINGLLKRSDFVRAIGIFTFMAFLLLMVCTVIAMLKSNFEDDSNGQQMNPAKVLRLFSQSIMTLMSGPFFIGLMITGSILLATVTSNVFTSGYSKTGKGRITFGSALCVSTMMNWNGTQAKSDAVIEKYLYNQGGYNYRNVDAVIADFNCDIATSLLGIICAIIVLLSMFKTVYVLIMRIYDIGVLVVIFPFLAATIPVDNGQKYKRWKDMFIGRVFITNGSYVVFHLALTIYLPWIVNADIDIGGSTYTYLLKVLLIIAAVTSISGFPQLAQGIFSYESAQLDIGNQQTATNVVNTVKDTAFSTLGKVKDMIKKSLSSDERQQQ